MCVLSLFYDIAWIKKLYELKRFSIIIQIKNKNTSKKDYRQGLEF